jgi:hypothetical protein
MYIPEGERSILEKTIYEVVGPTSSKEGGWLYTNLPKVLDTVSQAHKRIMEKGKT